MSRTNTPARRRTAAHREKRTVAHGFSYSKFLAQRTAAMGASKRSERTRERLRIGAVDALNQYGYHATTVEHIVAAAHLSHATFYLHFKSKPEIASDVLRGFLDDLGKWMEVALADARDEFDAANITTLVWIRAMRAN